MKNNKHILVISGFEPMHKKIHSVGGKITYLTRMKKLKSVQNELYHRVIGVKDDSEIDEWIDVAKHLHQLERFDAIDCFRENDQHIAVEIAKALNLTYNNDTEVINRTLNKYQMRKKLKEDGIGHIEFKRVCNLEEVCDFLSDKEVKFILKPIDAAGSKSIHLINPSQIDHDVLDIFFSEWNVGLIEEFVEGSEFSVESISEGGEHKVIGITEKFKDNRFIEIGHIVPARISESHWSIIESFVKSSLTSLGVMNGPSHTEVMMNGNIPYIIETHTRVGGDFIPELYKFSSNIDIMEIVSIFSIHKSILSSLPQKTSFRKYSMIKYITIENAGTLHELSGIEEAREVEGIEMLSINYRIGDKVKPTENSYSRFGFIIMSGECPEKLMQKMEETINLINIKVI